jgi:hypothetical protein
MTPEEARGELKRLGHLPNRTFQERNIVIASTSKNGNNINMID